MSFLSSTQVNMIRKDWKALLSSPESTQVILRYNKYKTGSISTFDDPYNYDKREIEDTFIEIPASCIQQVITERHIKILSYGIVELGESLFYFSPDFNFAEPDGANEVVLGSLNIVDPGGLVWHPVLEKVEQLERLLMLRIGEHQICQLIRGSINPVQQS